MKKLLLFIFLLLPLMASKSVTEPIKDCKCIKLYGRVKIVNALDDFRVKIVDSHEDFSARKIDYSPYKCGQWQIVVFKMKKVLLIILGIALTYGVDAQLRYGVKFGGTLSGLYMKSEGESDSSDPKIGIKAGGILEYSFSPSFALQPELLYINNGGKFEDDLSFNLHHLQLPVNVKYKMGTEKLKFYVTAGPYLGYIFAARLKMGTVSVDAFDKDINTGTGLYLKHLDFGVGAGFGIEIAERYIVGTGYKYGLANITGAEDVTVKVGTFNLSIGYLF